MMDLTGHKNSVMGFHTNHRVKRVRVFDGQRVKRVRVFDGQRVKRVSSSRVLSPGEVLLYPRELLLQEEEEEEEEGVRRDR
eukprot:1161392-Pelagomonas_calceolata.AAC.7